MSYAPGRHRKLARRTAIVISHRADPLRWRAASESGNGRCRGSARVAWTNFPAWLRGTMTHMSVTVASLNIRGVPLTGSRLTARCQAIGAFFEASDADVVCLQEVHTYYHLGQLARQMRSFRYASFRRTLPGQAGDLVTFSRLPVSAIAYQGFGAPPAAPGIRRLTRLRARMKGVLVTRLACPEYLSSTPMPWPTPMATGLRRTGSARFTAPSSCCGVRGLQYRPRQRPV
jgi:hypothetical protein